jgi:hypothetical protein
MSSIRPAASCCTCQIGMGVSFMESEARSAEPFPPVISTRPSTRSVRCDADYGPAYAAAPWGVVYPGGTSRGFESRVSARVSATRPRLDIAARWSFGRLTPDQMPNFSVVCSRSESYRANPQVSFIRTIGTNPNR